MCNKVATPAKDELAGYFEKQDVNQGHVLRLRTTNISFMLMGLLDRFCPLLPLNLREYSPCKMEVAATHSNE
jgi:hypothetical protein